MFKKCVENFKVNILDEVLKRLGYIHENISRRKTVQIQMIRRLQTVKAERK